MTRYAYLAGVRNDERWAHWAVDRGSGPLELWDTSGVSKITTIDRPTGAEDELAKVRAFVNCAEMDIEWSGLGVGQYHPRIWRPGVAPDPWSYYLAKWTASVQAARSLFHEMHEIFRSVEPHADNRGTHGHRIREVLALACMEVECACKAVLSANNYARADSQGTPVPAKHWNMRDYIKVADPLRLREWELMLPRYPDYLSVKPFADWTTGAVPPWYTAYNATKHDRENTLKQATLEHMIAALGGVYILLLAQFGRPKYGHQRTFDADDFVEIVTPKWSPSQYYVPPAVETPPPLWTAVPYAFV